MLVFNCSILVTVPRTTDSEKGFPNLYSERIESNLDKLKFRGNYLKHTHTSARAWASSLSAWQASETTIVRYCRSDAARAVDSTATSVAMPTSTRVSTPATWRMVSSAVPSNPLLACPLTTGSSGVPGYYIIHIL
jgi:hypothetical protein